MNAGTKFAWVCRGNIGYCEVILVNRSPLGGIPRGPHYAHRVVLRCLAATLHGGRGEHAQETRHKSKTFSTASQLPQESQRRMNDGRDRRPDHDLIMRLG